MCHLLNITSGECVGARIQNGAVRYQIPNFNSSSTTERQTRKRDLGPGRQEGARKKSRRGQDGVRAQAALWVPQGPPSGSGREVRDQPEYVNFLRPQGPRERSAGKPRGLHSSREKKKKKSPFASHRTTQWIEY